MTEPKNLENWIIVPVFLDEEMTMTAPAIRGFVDGKFIPARPIEWFDLEKKTVMTEVDILKLGSPNERWIKAFLANGNTLEGFDTTDTTH